MAVMRPSASTSTAHDAARGDPRRPAAPKSITSAGQAVHHAHGACAARRGWRIRPQHQAQDALRGRRRRVRGGVLAAVARGCARPSASSASSAGTSSACRARRKRSSAVAGARLADRRSARSAARSYAGHGAAGAVVGDLHRRLGQAERVGGLAHRVVEDVAQQQHRALARRQRLEREQEGERHALQQLVAALGRGCPTRAAARRPAARSPRRSRSATAARAGARRRGGGGARTSRARFIATRTSHGRHGASVRAGGRSMARRNVSCTSSSASAALPVMR